MKLPNLITSDYILRNKKRLQRNIEELNRQLSDIENTYPLGSPTKQVQQEYDDLYDLYIEYSKELEIILSLREWLIKEMKR